MNLAGFEYQTSEEVLAEVRKLCAAVIPAGYAGAYAVAPGDDARARGTGVVDVPMYQTDALVRRAPSLQKTREGRTAAVSY